MSSNKNEDVHVYVCRQCIPEAAHLPRQWTQNGVHVQTKELPCSGKIDAQYIFHAIESGARGVLVVTCPVGECALAQGNYRAEVRVQTVRRLLTEIGMEAERAFLVHLQPDEDVHSVVRQAVESFCALGKSPLGATG